MVKNNKNNVENNVRPQNKHLKPIKKGERLNPNGRPLGQKNYATIYKEALIKLAKVKNITPDQLEADLVLKGILLARGGDYRFYKDVMDRIHGTAVQRSDIHQKDEITFNDSENDKKLKKEWRDFIRRNHKTS